MRGLLRIVSKDPYLAQKLRRELCEEFDRIEVTEQASGIADAMIYDCRLGAPMPRGENVFYLTDEPSGAQDGQRCLPLPLPLGLAKEMLRDRGEPMPLSFPADGRAVLLYGERIRLTEVELLLLKTLFEAKGEFLGREVLMKAVWGDEGTNSLLNVYIHYLREKLERGGEKIILSSRGGGYALTKKVIGGECEC